MDFLNFFGLKEDPFKLTPDPAYFYPSSTHNEGLLLLDYSVEQKEGFTTVIGDPGSGKTTLLNVFLEKWKPKAEIAMVLTPRLSPEEFLVSVLEDLNINLKRKNKNEIIKAFRDFMIEKSSEGRRIIIIIDEAQNVPEDTLEELRLLSNLETDKEKLLQVVMIGQPELESKLTADKLRQLNQRITTRIHLGHLGTDETLDYINHRLIKAGKQNLKINKKAGKLVHKLTSGIPRLINLLVSRALMAAYLEENNTIFPQHVTHAVKSLNHSELTKKSQNRLVSLFAGFILILLAGVIGYIYLHDKITGSTEKITVPSNASTPLPLTTPKAETTTVQPSESVRTTAPLNTSAPAAKEFKAVLSPALLPQEEKARDQAAEMLSGENLTKSVPQGTASGGRYIIVAVNTANIREMPTLTSRKVGQMLKGNRFGILQETVDERNIRWYQIPYGEDKYWISESVVKVE
ncbi:MAG: AAA family ATPase [Nitrospirae bacterium]|nr:AAA family ATPase [Nitrospirota bacterium]